MNTNWMIDRKLLLNILGISERHFSRLVKEGKFKVTPCNNIDLKSVIQYYKVMSEPSTKDNHSNQLVMKLQKLKIKRLKTKLKSEYVGKQTVLYCLAVYSSITTCVIKNLQANLPENPTKEEVVNALESLKPTLANEIQEFMSNHVK